MGMTLFTEEINRALLDAGSDGETAICKLFGGPATWVLFGAEPDNPDTLWGVADLGHGCVEFGTVSRRELEALKIPPFGLRLERDLHFRPGKSLEYYLNQTTLTGID
jgi:hypothetical protein